MATRNTSHSTQRKQKAPLPTTQSRAVSRRTSKPPAPPVKETPIVGIGASAGGLDAMKELLTALPTDTGMAFVLVQHLEPKHESILTKLLARATSMPVHEIREGMRAEPNHVYVIPANADLNLLNGLLHMVKRKAPAGRHLPIDYFLHSLAETRGDRAVGVILSGTGSDGTAGLAAIRAEGGITFAQQPESAGFDGMPRSAIEEGCVDFVLPPAGIARELARIARSPVKAILSATPALSEREDDWTKLFRLLRNATGVDFSFYKKSTIRRRLARRMTVWKADTLHAYLKILEGNPEELGALFQEILLTVTSFFRDPDVFVALQKQMLPQILADKPARDPIRIWVAGCSTGEEVYSIAMSVLEYLRAKHAERSIQIFGTDVSEPCLDKARTAVYSEQAVQEIPRRRLQRFFTRVDGRFQVVQPVREMCLFARHDVTKDPPFSKLDLISCRNLLIYLEPVLQKKVLASFHYGLNDRGMLLLGKTESLGGFTDLFTLTDRKNKFFLKNRVARVPFEIPYAAHAGLVHPARAAEESVPAPGLEREADRLVWEHYSHAGLIINSDLQILHFRGDTSVYVRPAPGKATFHLLKMLRDELVMEVRAAIQKVRKTGAGVRREGVHFHVNRHEREINLEVIPLPPLGAHEKCYLILFEEPGGAPPPPLPAVPTDKRSRDREITTLRKELARTREYLQTVIQEQESANEELKTANEEALSSMEELQSTNEELETAKEELQSSNEELVTLNEQLQNHNLELAHLTDDLSNVLSGVDIPILIVGSDRRIRRFTPPAEKLLRLLPGDVGRPITNLRLGVPIPDLEQLITDVIDRNSGVDRAVKDESGHAYLLRVRPFRTSEQKVEGVLIAFLDVDELQRSQERLATEVRLATAILNVTKDLLVVVLDAEGRILRFNLACRELTGYTSDEVNGRFVWDFLLLPEEVDSVKATFKGLLAGESGRRENYWLTKDGRRRLIEWSNTVAFKDSGALEYIIATGFDVTRQREVAARASESEATILALLESTTQGILAADDQGVIVLVNAAAENLFGYRSEEMIGRKVEMLMPERFRKKHIKDRNTWFRQPRNRPMGSGMELFALCKDGTEFPVEISLSVVKSDGKALDVSIVSDITDRKKNEAMLLQNQKDLQRLTASLIEARESANRELARELHDAFSQRLAVLRMEVSTMLANHAKRLPPPVVNRMEELGQEIGELGEDMHRVSRHLHPAILEDLGLEAALRGEFEMLSQQSGIPVDFTAASLPPAIPKDRALCIYRVTQEALNNIFKYANARDVAASLTGHKGGVTLLIEDRGKGFDVEAVKRKGSLGLISMEERVRMVNGKFSIDSEPGVGTSVSVWVPTGEEPK